MSEYVTIELAKKLKEKGFPLLRVIKQRGEPIIYDLPKNHPNWQNCNAYYIPTISQVLKWLREEKKIHLIVEISDSGWYYTLYPNVRWENDKLKSDKYIMSFKHKTSYEEAVLAGIEYILDNLIQL